MRLVKPESAASPLINARRLPPWPRNSSTPQWGFRCAKMILRWRVNSVATHAGCAKTTRTSPGAARAIVETLVTAGEPACLVQAAILATASASRKCREDTPRFSAGMAG
jgi:hypothetical protein